MNISYDDFFAALSNPIRLRCLVLLVHETELCVCELTHALRVAQPVISRHLALLRETGLVADRREGVWIHYRLNPDLHGWTKIVLAATAEGVVDDAPFAKDLRTLHQMPNRPGAPVCA